MTIEQILAETRGWSSEQIGELLDRLALELHHSDQHVENAWKSEVRRRVVEIESGKAKLVPGDEVSTRIRRAVGR